MSCDKSVEKVAKPRILVAEDNFGNYKLAEVILRRDYDVLHADNGEEAVEIFQSQGADLVLMDIRMPVMDGINAFHGIRQISPAVPVIALTAYTYDGDRQFLIAEGFNDYIIKPYTSEILRNHVSALLLR